MTQTSRIHLVDPEGLLYYAAHFLHKLDDSAYSITVENQASYGHFLKRFRNIKTQDARKPDLTICFVNNLEKATAKLNTLYYKVATNPVQNDILNTCSDNFDRVKKHLNTNSLDGKRFLISAGPTIEDVDPVRFFSNRSTGKMGIALARAAYIRGANVTLVIGPTSVYVPEYLSPVRVRNATQMHKAVHEHFATCDFYISAAAVADYTPVAKLNSKMKKGTGNLAIEMQRTQDILKDVRNLKTDQILVGFSVETENLIENSRKKMQRKGLDMIVANNPNIQGAGFAGDTNQVELLTETRHISLPLLSKDETAFKILDFIAENRPNG